jgi:hypothetical protein
MNAALNCEAERRLDLLDARLDLNLSLNDLRILVGSFRALEYQMGLDDAPYLDMDGLALKRRLEEAYRGMLLRLGLQTGGIGTV